MTPNLEKLFAEADFSQLEFDYNYTNPGTMRAARLLIAHGEALIEALEDAHASLHVYVEGGNPTSPYKNGMNPCYVMGSREILCAIQHLLSTLEQEATS